MFPSNIKYLEEMEKKNTTFLDRKDIHSQKFNSSLYDLYIWYNPNKISVCVCVFHMCRIKHADCNVKKPAGNPRKIRVREKIGVEKGLALTDIKTYHKTTISTMIRYGL